jgi:hypothetical protein
MESLAGRDSQLQEERDGERLIVAGLVSDTFLGKES